jgi:GntR family transcriptional regulator/MocR family aminotransferase
MRDLELFELAVTPLTKGTRGAAKVLHQQIRVAILEGRLSPGLKLPAMRRAALYFGVSRNLAAQVYEQLLSEGLVVTRHGSGTYIANVAACRTPGTLRRAAAGADPRLNPFWRRGDTASALGFFGSAPVSDEPNTNSRPEAQHIDMRPTLIDARLFPMDLFRAVLAKQLRHLERRPGRYRGPSGNQGNYWLRHAISRHISLTRALAVRPEDILITSGAQQAFDVLARVLVIPNETVVAVEDPGYPPLRVPFAAAGAKVVPVGVDDEGLIVDHLPPVTNVICVCPSHQFPLGVSMSRRRRQSLVEFARTRGAVIVEDDYDGEFRYDTRPLEALHNQSSADTVFYVGTFSKCMFTALRLGYLVAPEWALASLVAAKNSTDWHSSTPTQIGVSAFMREGHLKRHIRRLRTIYGERRQLLLAALERDFGDWLMPIAGAYGTHVTALARRALDLDAVTMDLSQQHIQLHSLTRYYVRRPTRAGLVFGFGVADAPQLRKGLAALHRLLVS